MSVLSLILYIPLQIAFIPFAILGFVLVAYKQLVVSKRLGVPQSAIEILNGRWTMHIFGMRSDKSGAALASTMPNNSVAGLWLVLFPLWLKFKISGRFFLYPRAPEPGSESLVDLVVARTLYFDRVIDRVIAEVDQFVFMGAGYDMRAYGGFRRDGVSFFEIDRAGMQQHKRATLEKAGISCGHVIFVEVDFSKENAFTKLLEAGYDPGKKTLFLWEGVTLYLSEADVRKTMQDLRGNAAAGSVLLADIYAHRLLARFSRAAGKVLEYSGEGVDFSLDFATDHVEKLSSFVESESMSMGETFFLGSKGKKGPFVVVAEMKID